MRLFCIPKILKNESNSQLKNEYIMKYPGCFVSQRYWKMKAIHNKSRTRSTLRWVVLYPKDTEKWKQFTTANASKEMPLKLFCIPKILKNESNSQLYLLPLLKCHRCFVSQRYWKMKAIHNCEYIRIFTYIVVLYPKDTEKWKQFTTLRY